MSNTTDTDQKDKNNKDNETVSSDVNNNNDLDETCAFPKLNTKFFEEETTKIDVEEILDDPDYEEVTVAKNHNKLIISGFAVIAVLLLFAAVYFTFAYSNISAIAKARENYIQSVMSSDKNTWRATLLFSDSVIEKAMQNSNDGTILLSDSEEESKKSEKEIDAVAGEQSSISEETDNSEIQPITIEKLPDSDDTDKDENNEAEENLEENLEEKSDEINDDMFDNDEEGVEEKAEGKTEEKENSILSDTEIGIDEEVLQSVYQFDTGNVLLNSEYNAEKRDTSYSRSLFYDLFYDIDKDSMDNYISNHEEMVVGGWDQIQINGIKQNGTGIYTVYGDEILAIDAEDGVLLIRVYVDDSSGILAICNDANNLSLCTAQNIGTVGQYIGYICDQNEGVVAITGCDSLNNGSYAGGLVSGLVVSKNVIYGSRLGKNYSRLELRSNGKMYIINSEDSVSSDTVSACESKSAAIVDGAIVQSDDTDKEPRAFIGQNENGSVMMLVVEGQYVDSPGCSIVSAAELLKKYGCTGALSVGSGSNIVMYYKGEYITRCSDPSLPYGSLSAAAWVFSPSKNKNGVNK